MQSRRHIRLFLLPGVRVRYVGLAELAPTVA
jgi:hypothetical protein